MITSLALRQKKRVEFTTHTPTKDNRHDLLARPRKTARSKRGNPASTPWKHFIDSVATVFVAGFGFFGAVVAGIVLFHIHVVRVLLRYLSSTSKTD